MSGPAEGSSVLPQLSESPRSIGSAHDRVYTAAVLSRERLKPTMRSAEQVCCPRPAADMLTDTCASL